MTQDKPIPGSPLDWMKRAKGDLTLARIPLPEGAFLEDLCFHAQQAAEKSLKAVYLHFGLSFRYTHDLEELVTGLNQQGFEIPAEIEAATLLTSFAWEARYPALSEPVTDKEYHDAVQKAETIVRWAESLIEKD